MRRRELLKRAGFAGRAVAGVGAAAMLEWTPRADAQNQSDTTILSYLIELEQFAVHAYRRVLGTGELAYGSARDVRQLLSQERAHIAALARELHALGTQPPVGPTTDAAADALLSAHGQSGRISSLHTEQDCLQVLLDVEQILIGGYFSSISKLESTTALRRSAEIMANEAQHAALLGELLTPDDVMKIAPTPFVQGAR
ncbi:MAG: ferritin-like domain-containing protein [Solirubrobacterales bacterium]|nr:ferritin-like domain-containing protein [Solirubrobacterales bacterium]